MLMTKDLHEALIRIEQSYTRYGHGPLTQWGCVAQIDVAALSDTEVIEAMDLAYGDGVAGRLRGSEFAGLIEGELEQLLGGRRANTIGRIAGLLDPISPRSEVRRASRVLASVVAATLVAVIAMGSILWIRRNPAPTDSAVAAEAVDAPSAFITPTPRDKLVTASFALAAVADCRDNLRKLERDVRAFQDHSQLREMVTGVAAVGDADDKGILRRQMNGTLGSIDNGFRTDLSETAEVCRKNQGRLTQIEAVLSAMKADILPSYRGCLVYLETMARSAEKAREDGVSPTASGLPYGDGVALSACFDGFHDKGVGYENRHLILAWDPTTIPRDAGLSGDLSIGSPDAPVHIIETTNFACPTCRTSWARNMPAIRALAASGKVFYTLKESFPDRTHPGDETPDDTISFFVTARCLGGADAYWKGIDTLYSTPLASHDSVTLEREGTAPLYGQTCVEGISEDFLKRAEKVAPTDNSLPRLEINGLVFTDDAAAVRGIHSLIQEATAPAAGHAMNGGDGVLAMERPSQVLELGGAPASDVPRGSAKP